MIPQKENGALPFSSNTKPSVPIVIPPSFPRLSLPLSLSFFPSLQRDMAVRKDVKLVVKAWHLGELLRRSLAVRIHSKAPRLLILRQLYLTGIQPSVPGFLVVLENPGTWSFMQDVP